jgi:large subunit ribosomal protein L6
MSGEKLFARFGKNMSRIAKIPVSIPTGVAVSFDQGLLTINGPRGTLTVTVPEGCLVEITDGVVNVSMKNDGQKNLAGLVRALTANCVKGVSEGWSKIVELSGTGYRAAATESELNLALGFSHPVIIKAPPGIVFEVKENKISVKGADKALVGEVAAKIRALKPADPYKAKGLKYENEIIIKKAGKAAKAGGAPGAAK